MMFRSAILLMLGAGALAACGEKSAPPQETGDAAAQGAKGEVIGGTITDDMLPLDRLRSQSPPMSEDKPAGSASGRGAAAPATPAPAAPADTPDAAPAAEPAAEAET